MTYTKITIHVLGQTPEGLEEMVDQLCEALPDSGALDAMYETETRQIEPEEATWIGFTHEEDPQ